MLEGLALGHSTRLLLDELDRRWPDTEDPLAAMSRYALFPPGKLLRAIMTMQCAAAVGGRQEDVLSAALGIEYVHAATLVHDDIIDGGLVRRGRPAVPVAFGTADAIVTGDHLIFVAYAAVTECPAREELVVRAVSALAAAGADLCRGQVLESRLTGDLTAGVAGYLEVARLKTGALFRAACHVGAILGGGGPGASAALAEYGEHLGIAFQITDDLLPYVAPASVIGKSPESDLVNGRVTLPVLLAHELGSPADRAELAAALGGGVVPSAAGFEAFGALLHRTGAVELSRRRAGAHIRRAEERLAEVGSGADVLAAIARWTTTRRW